MPGSSANAPTSSRGRKWNAESFNRSGEASNGGMVEVCGRRQEPLVAGLPDLCKH
jgi:hypothetical protein